MQIKTLVILSPGFPINEADDTCLPFLQQFIIQLNSSFPLLNIQVLAFDYPLAKTNYIWRKNLVIAFNGKRKTKINRLFKWRGIWAILKKINDSHAIVGILSMWAGECAALGKLFSGKSNIPHYCWILGQDAKPGNKYFKSIKIPASGLIAISDFIQKEFENNYATKPRYVIPVGIPENYFKATTQKRDIDILGVGSLIELKQYHILIEIIQDLIQLFPQIKVRICGQGPEMSGLQSLIFNKGLENNMLLTGELKHDEILELMHRTKLFLHPSLYEGMAAVCLEALASGCHVISFVQSMHQEILQWHIVSSKEEMIRKTISLLENISLQFQSTLPFTTRNSAEKIMELFRYREDIIV